MKLVQNTFITAAITVTLFISMCDPHPFSSSELVSGKHLSGLYWQEKAHIPGGETTNVINVTVVPPSLQDNTPVPVKTATKLFDQQPPYKIFPPLPNNHHIFSSLSLGNAIKRGRPAADAKSNKSLATSKVSKRDLLSPALGSSGDVREKRVGNNNNHDHLHHHHPSIPERGEPSTLFDLELGDTMGTEEEDSKKLILKLDKEYTPKEIADYIYSTGDEKGITQTVWEMLQDGQIMSTEDVISFLEAVQERLAEMQQKQKRKRPAHSDKTKVA